MCGLERSGVLSLPCVSLAVVIGSGGRRGSVAVISPSSTTVGNWKAFPLGMQNPQHLPWLWMPRVGRFVLRAAWQPVCSVDSMEQGRSCYSQGPQVLPPSNQGERTHALSSSRCQGLCQAPCIHVSCTPLSVLFLPL